ncbi:MAG: ABC transporter permease [Bifidobacteriaceae bacterium]|jgi:peptide/nickel transport system permease protein|nr:ABC transporter permease [Bifidobacteriaceae bacterium]
MVWVRRIGLRLASLLAVLLALTILLFFLQEVAHFDPVAATLGANASPEAIAAERARLGLDAPVLQRYFIYLGGLLHGDLGTSVRTRHPVAQDIGQFFPASAELVLFAYVLALVLAVAFAASSVLRWPGGAVGRGVMFLLAAAPSFLLGIVGVIVFYSRLGWFPGAGRLGDASQLTDPTGFMTIDALLAGRLDLFGDALHHLLLPALALAVGPALAIGRVLRSALEATTGAEFIKTAQVKGLGEGAILRRHVIRNSLPAPLAMAGLYLGYMFAGVVVVERVFTWPGLGLYMFNSLLKADFQAVAGSILVLGVIYVTSNAIVDVLQTVADPRISFD